MFVGYENTNVGGTNHIFGISGILSFIKSYAIALNSSFVGIFSFINCFNSCLVGILGIDIPGNSISGIKPSIVSLTNFLISSFVGFLGKFSAIATADSIAAMIGVKMVSSIGFIIVSSIILVASSINLSSAFFIISLRLGNSGNGNLTAFLICEPMDGFFFLASSYFLYKSTDCLMIW